MENDSKNLFFITVINRAHTYFSEALTEDHARQLFKTLARHGDQMRLELHACNFKTRIDYHPKDK